MLLTSALILVTPGLGEERIFDGGGEVRRPEPIALPMYPLVVTGAGSATTTSVGMRLGVTPATVGSQASQQSQGPQGSHGWQGSKGSEGSEESRGFQTSQGSKGSKRSKGFQRLEESHGPPGSQGSQGSLNGETKTVPVSTTVVDDTITTTGASTTGTTPLSGSVSSSTGTGSIDAVYRLPVSSKKGKPGTGCLKKQVNGLRQTGRRDEQNDDCLRDGPPPEEKRPSCDPEGISADYSELLR